MHSLTVRLNTVLTFFGSVAAVLCILVTASDLLHSADPPVSLSLTEVKRLSLHRGTHDQAALSLKLDADLSSAFSWNTKQLFVFVQAEYATPSNAVNQVVLWDKIVTRKEDARIKLRALRQKYAFLDQGAGLRGRDLNLTLSWNVMPKVGRLVTRSKSFPAGPLPDEYTA